MTRLLFREVRYRLWLMPLSAVAFEVIWKANNVSAGQADISMLEYNFFFLPIVCCCLLLGSENEVDLIRTSNTRLSDIMLMRYVVTYLFTAVYPVTRVFSIYGEGGGRMAFTLMTTLLFSTSLSLFMRVLIKSTYGSALFAVLAHLLLLGMFSVILVKWFNVLDPRTLERLNPYQAYSIENVGRYRNNRSIVCSVSAAIIILSYLLTRFRERFNRE